MILWRIGRDVERDGHGCGASGGMGCGRPCCVPRLQAREAPFGQTLPPEQGGAANRVRWNGVTCSSTRPYRVAELSLPTRSLSGQISSFLGNLTSLECLDLSGNNFVGPLITSPWPPATSSVPCATTICLESFQTHLLIAPT